MKIYYVFFPINFMFVFLFRWCPKILYEIFFLFFVAYIFIKFNMLMSLYIAFKFLSFIVSYNCC